MVLSVSGSVVLEVVIAELRVDASSVPSDAEEVSGILSAND